METVSTETENIIIDEVGSSSVIVFESSDACAWVGVLCGICRVEPDNLLACTIFKLID